MNVEELLYEENPPRRKRRKTRSRASPKRRRRATRNPGRKRRTSSVASKKAVAKSRKHYVPVVVVNPIGRDVVKDLKTGGLITAGLIGAYWLGSYLKEKFPDTFADADKTYMLPIATIAAGVGVGVVLPSKYRDIGTKVGLGVVATGLLLAVTPYIADKVPGLPMLNEGGPSKDAFIDIPPGTQLPMKGYTDMGAYVRDLAGIGGTEADLYFNGDSGESYGV